ncbi:hypothetical protein GIB67_037039 [Kingdonia uniflora]|uniref:Uncharacterized protein n=1 Tax=Kingdonia uniflora TaxID=39325 RepID=A0A7J7LHH8_9MAGN|nr:hypothetical protein GIB67_037039 [Kingdonia uniflora]
MVICGYRIRGRILLRRGELIDHASPRTFYFLFILMLGALLCFSSLLRVWGKTLETENLQLENLRFCNRSN